MRQGVKALASSNLALSECPGSKTPVATQMTNRSMLDHISIAVSDLRRSIMFYDAALAPLGFVRVWSTEDAAGYGYPDQDENFAIKQRVSDEPLGWSARSHIAFHAASRDAAIAFHAKALENSGIDEGPPGLCPEYGDGYFAAFVRDPDGYRLEAVVHE